MSAETIKNKVVTLQGLQDYNKKLLDEIPRMGLGNRVEGDFSYAFGCQNTVIGNNVMAIGTDLWVNRDASVEEPLLIIGCKNSWNEKYENAAFIIGAGKAAADTDGSGRKDVFRINYDGSIFMPSSLFKENKPIIDNLGTVRHQMMSFNTNEALWVNPNESGATDTLNINVRTPGGVKIPSTISFNAGDTTKFANLTFKGFELKTLWGELTKADGSKTSIYKKVSFKLEEDGQSPACTIVGDLTLNGGKYMDLQGVEQKGGGNLYVEGSISSSAEIIAPTVSATEIAADVFRPTENEFINFTGTKNELSRLFINVSKPEDNHIPIKEFYFCNGTGSITSYGNIHCNKLYCETHVGSLTMKAKNCAGESNTVNIGKTAKFICIHVVCDASYQDTHRAGIDTIVTMSPNGFWTKTGYSYDQEYTITVSPKYASTTGNMFVPTPSGTLEIKSGDIRTMSITNYQCKLLYVIEE